MRLVFIYGPPAVGKLSVARELSALTGFKVLHNHLTIDLVATVFPFGSGPFRRLVDRFRRNVIEEAALQRVDLLFTFVYAAGEDEQKVRDLIAPVVEHDGTVLLVQLTCSRDTLLERVSKESRRVHGKLTDEAALLSVLDRYDLFQPLPFGNTLQIDTTSLSPGEAAARIVAHYNLPRA